MPRRPILTELDRRAFLALGTAAGLAGMRGAHAQGTAAPAAPTLPEYTPIPEKLKGTGEVRVANYGGTMQDAQRKAYYEPFGRLSGITTKDFAGADINKVKAMVDTGNYEWDVVQLGRGTVHSLMKHGDYFEKIDYDLVDTANIDPVYRDPYALDMLVWAEVMAYRTDAFKGAVPAGWADFWNATKFPGDRTMIGAGPLSPELEMALMAAGVVGEEIYPIDVDKAFASFDKIKPHVVKWWETGAVPVQMLTDKEVVLATVWNGRMAALQAAGVPAAVSWPQGLLKRDCWAVPKGTPNRVNAMKFMGFGTGAIAQARLSMLIPYGSVNNQSNQYIPPAQLAVLPSAPAIKSQLVPYDYAWWTDNRDAVVAKWNKWVLG
jgi:putative spermidine/putrescine transport system substrate-binding protein